eukprot:1335123-Amphidinium_carterae.1
MLGLYPCEHNCHMHNHKHHKGFKRKTSFMLWRVSFSQITVRKYDLLPFIHDRTKFKKRDDLRHKAIAQKWFKLARCNSEVEIWASGVHQRFCQKCAAFRTLPRKVGKSQKESKTPPQNEAVGKLLYASVMTSGTSTALSQGAVKYSSPTVQHGLNGFKYISQLDEPQVTLKCGTQVLATSCLLSPGVYQRAADT